MFSFSSLHPLNLSIHALRNLYLKPLDTILPICLFYKNRSSSGFINNIQFKILNQKGKECLFRKKDTGKSLKLYEFPVKQYRYFKDKNFRYSKEMEKYCGDNSCNVVFKIVCVQNDFKTRSTNLIVLRVILPWS